MAEEVRAPNFTNYHKSLTHELHSLKNRIRDIVQDRHWLTDGEFKEVALRNVLRRHMPESLLVGRGFVVSPTATSTQIDILIVDGNTPTLFKDGDLMIVTPDSVRGAIEVKTTLGQPSLITRAVNKLAAIGRLCDTCLGQSNSVWTGLFVYDSDAPDHEVLLKAVGKAYTQHQHAVTSISYGRNTFLRYWSQDEVNENGVSDPMRGPFWRSYELENLAPAYFVGNALGGVSPKGANTSGYAWFPLITGKEPCRRFQLQQGSADPTTAL